MVSEGGVARAGDGGRSAKVSGPGNCGSGGSGELVMIAVQERWWQLVKVTGQQRWLELVIMVSG